MLVLLSVIELLDDNDDDESDSFSDYFCESS